MSQEQEEGMQSTGSEADFYNMSDDEIMNYNPSDLPEYDAQEDDSVDVEDDQDTITLDEDPVDQADVTEDDDEDQEDGDDSDADNGDADPEAVADDKDEAKDTDDTDEDDSTTTNFEAEYKKILAPFTANGKEMQVKDVDEALTLMKMGANYNKKMVGLKPHMKLLKVLENNNLLGDEQIGYLIDLHNKDPKAIGKLVKESGLDPLDLDVEASSDYVPSKHTVSDSELALGDVLDEIEHSEHYGKTVDLVTKEWDDRSKRKVAEEPVILKVINDHMASGVYDVISNELNRKRALGQLNGLSDLEAYKQVGDGIQEQGGFDHLFVQEQRQQAPTATKRLPPKQKQEDPKLKEKRRAASSTRSVPASRVLPADFNPLAMSDEDFEKQFSSKLL